MNILKKYNRLYSNCPIYGLIYIKEKAYEKEDGYDLLEELDRDSEERTVETILQNLYSKQSNEEFFKNAGTP